MLATLSRRLLKTTAASGAATLAAHLVPPAERRPLAGQRLQVPFLGIGKHCPATSTGSPVPGWASLPSARWTSAAPVRPARFPKVPICNDFR